MAKQNEKQAAGSANVLPAALQSKYEVAPGVLAKFADKDFGVVDLTIITEENAKQLAERGYLIALS